VSWITSPFISSVDGDAQNMELPVYDTVWKFVGYTEDQVAKLFESQSCPRRSWPNCWIAEMAARGRAHRPAQPQAVWDGAEARATIYSILGRWRKTLFITARCHSPATMSARGCSGRTCPGGADHDREERLPANKNLVFVTSRSSCGWFRRGGTAADSQGPQPHANLIVKLRLSPGDVTKIADYWAATRA
jgi:hypothetical protein